MNIESTYRHPADAAASPATGTNALPGRLAYSVTEAANAIGLGKTTLYALIGQGRLPSSKIGKRRIIRHADLEALIAGQQSLSA